MAAFPTIWIVHSIGVRQGLDLRICRMKDGRQQRQIEVLRNKGDDANRSKPRWIDSALIFKTEADAQAAYRWARNHRERHSMRKPISDVLIGVDYIASLAMSAKPEVSA